MQVEYHSKWDIVMLTLKLNTYYYNMITFAGNKTNSDNKYNTKQNLQDFKYEAYAVCYLLLQDMTVQSTETLLLFQFIHFVWEGDLYFNKLKNWNLNPTHGYICIYFLFGVLGHPPEDDSLKPKHFSTLRVQYISLLLQVFYFFYSKFYTTEWQWEKVAFVLFSSVTWTKIFKSWCQRNGVTTFNVMLTNRYKYCNWKIPAIFSFNN